MTGWTEIYVSPQSEKAEEKRRYLEDKGISCMMKTERGGQPTSGETLAFRSKYSQPNMVYKVLVKDACAKEAEALLKTL